MGRVRIRRVVDSTFGVVFFVALGVGLAVFLLYLAFRPQSETQYARSQVQALFVTSASQRTAVVESCREIGEIQDQTPLKIWACALAGTDCVRTYKFVVDHARNRGIRQPGQRRRRQRQPVSKRRLGSRALPEPPFLDPLVTPHRSSGSHCGNISDADG